MDYSCDYKNVTRYMQISACVRNIRRLSLKSADVRTYAKGGGVRTTDIGLVRLLFI